MEDLLPCIPESSVDLIIADLPYGKIKSQWDILVDMEWLWGELSRVSRSISTPIIMFCQGSFMIDLINSNRKDFRYDLVWEKDRPSGHLNAKRQPMRAHENMVVFYGKQPTYNPQMWMADKPIHSRGDSTDIIDQGRTYGGYNSVPGFGDKDPKLRYPRSVWKFNRPHPPVHPTQKPVELVEELIKTFSNEGELVLDPCFGSGTTALASISTNRSFVGFESSEEYFKIAEKRVANALQGAR